MSSIDRFVGSITEDRRASYLFSTKTASEAVGCHPRKFNDWWARTRAKLIELQIAQPGELLGEIAGMAASAEAERRRRAASPQPSPHLHGPRKEACPEAIGPAQPARNSRRTRLRTSSR